MERQRLSGDGVFRTEFSQTLQRFMNLASLHSSNSKVSFGQRKIPSPKLSGVCAFVNTQLNLPYCGSHWMGSAEPIM